MNVSCIDYIHTVSIGLIIWKSNCLKHLNVLIQITCNNNITQMVEKIGLNNAITLPQDDIGQYGLKTQ